MKPGLLVLAAVGLATLLMPIGVSAQAPELTQQSYAPRCLTSGSCSLRIDGGDQELASLAGAPSLNLSPRTHDDWAVPMAPVALSLDLSLRVHDDWAVGRSSAAPVEDLSLRSHDDWPLLTAE